jgi:hypothetical protein
MPVAIQSNANEEDGAAALGGYPIIDDMQRVVVALAEQAAAVKAASVAVAAHASFDLAMPNSSALRRNPGAGRDDPTEQLMMIAADIRSRSAFVSGAAQSLQACIAAAALAITELAVAISVATGSSVHGAYLPAIVDDLAAQADTAIARLTQNTRQIDEIVDYIARTDLNADTLALGEAIYAAREADASDGFVAAAGQAHRLSAQIEQLTAQVQVLATTIVQGANEARTVMARAGIVIADMRAAMHPTCAAQAYAKIGSVRVIRNDRKVL